jgi:uncharacterized protein involved in exopolysaccharide biosynthesis
MTSWIDAERSNTGDVRRELRRLARRSVARPFRTLLLALLCTAAVVGVRARKNRSYESCAVIRAVESDLDAATAPRPARELRLYVLEVAFSNQRLLDVITTFNIYQKQMQRDPLFAVESFRDDLEVEVWRNYFLETRQLGEAGRSARIAISYRHSDPTMARDVTAALANLLVQEAALSRTREAEAGMAQARANADAMRTELLDRNNRLRRAERQLQSALGPERARLALERNDQLKQIATLETRLKALVAEETERGLRVRMEESNLGLRFEVVDAPRKARPGLSKARELTLLGCILFLFILPLAGIAVGAFDARVHTAEDLRRLGLVVMGHVPPFDGAAVGSLDARLARDHRVD